MDAELLSLLQKQCELYPKVQIQDLVKLVYQNEFGPGHLIRSEAESLSHLKAEYANLNQTQSAPVFEDIGNGLSRLHLAGSDLDISTVNRIFMYTARQVAGSQRNFAEKLAQLMDWRRQGLLPLSESEAEEWLSQYQKQGCPMVSHSAAYKAAYSPAYRIVLAVFQDYYPLFQAIDKLLKSPDPVLVAIDGNSCAGKSTLAALLEQVYPCNVFHMDDFFLPANLKTRERLQEPGGNVQYERFLAEIMAGLKDNLPFSFRPFNCKNQALGEAIQVQPKQLNIIEGAYSLHPKLAENYSLKVFLAVNPEEQSRRVLARNGIGLHHRFLAEWIPLEDRYFEEMKIREQCDLVFTN